MVLTSSINLSTATTQQQQNRRKEDMTRKADPQIVKLKRKVIKLKSDLDTIAKQLAMYIGYKYSPSEWDALAKDFDEETKAMHETTVARFNAAHEIANLKSRKRQLRKLASSGSLSNSQVAAYASIKEKVAEAINKMSQLPDLGTSFADWAALPAEFKQKSVGHPKVTLEEDYVTTRSELNLTHKQVNDLEDDGSKSTIDDIMSEEEAISVNAGRKKLPSSVSDIEELERKKRTLISQIEEIKAEPEEQEVKKGRGKRKLSKEARLEKKTTAIASINEQIDELESTLDAKEYGLRYKRVLEREKRYAKEDGKNRDVKKISNRLTTIASVIKRVEAGSVTDAKAKEMIDKAVSAVDITIEDTVQNIINEAVNSVSNADSEDNSTTSDEKSISDIFDSIELPRF